MKHFLPLITALIGLSLPVLKAAEEPLPTVSATPRWITIRYGEQRNGRPVPLTIMIRKDTIISIEGRNEEQPLAQEAWPDNPPDAGNVPVSIVIKTNQDKVTFYIPGLTAATAPTVMERIQSLAESADPAFAH